MGAVDLVVQVESPKSVARGLQRVGRAGHELGAVSKGRIFPKFRADLLECAVVAKAMREGAIEETAIPRNPLDVLAQQVVAICAEDEIAVDELHELRARRLPVRRALARAARERARHARRPVPVGRVRRAAAAHRLGPHRRCDPRPHGRPPARGDERGDDPRPRAVRRLPVGRRRSRRRARRGDGLRGARGADVHARRLDLADRGDHARPRARLAGARRPGAVPFWKGEGVGRPYELGARIGGASRELAALSDKKATKTLRDEYHLDELASENLLTFLREQEAASALPTDRTVVVERFRDEIGDWRVCILTPFGGRVHAPWSMALAGAAARTLALEVQSLWSDDGIALHLPDADVPPALADLLVEPDELEDLVVQEVGADGALRRALPRERRARAPHPAAPSRPADAALAAAPQGAEPARGRAASTARSRSSSRRTASASRTSSTSRRSRHPPPASRRASSTSSRSRPASASPMAASLLFDYVATYMYEDDTPAAERRAQALSLDRELLRELLGQEELRDLLDPGALAEVEGSLRPAPRNADELHDLLRRVGDLREGELDAGFAETLVRERRAFRARVGGADAVIAAEDAGPLPGRLRRDAAGRPSRGVPRAGRRRARAACCSATRARAARSRPREVAALRPRAEDVETAARGARGADLLVRGELRPGGVEREWCDPDVLRRIRRASLAVLRREVEPAEQAALGRFLPTWHGIDRRATLREALVPLQGLRCRSASGRPRSSPAACRATSRPRSTSSARRARSSGSAPGLDRVALYYREDAPGARPADRREPLAGAGARRDPRRARPERRVLARPAGRDRARRRRRRCRRSGSSSGTAR